MLAAALLFVILLWPTLLTNYRGFPPPTARLICALEMLSRSPSAGWGSCSSTAYSIDNRGCARGSMGTDSGQLGGQGASSRSAWERRVQSRSAPAIRRRRDQGIQQGSSRQSQDSRRQVAHSFDGKEIVHCWRMRQRISTVLIESFAALPVGLRLLTPLRFAGEKQPKSSRHPPKASDHTQHPDCSPDARLEFLVLRHPREFRILLRAFEI